MTERTEPRVSDEELQQDCASAQYHEDHDTTAPLSQRVSSNWDRYALDLRDCRAALVAERAARERAEILATKQEWARDIAKALDQARNACLNIADCIEDEGDRVYFGSTMDADRLREVAQNLDDYGWAEKLKNTPPNALPTNVFESLRAAKARIAELERQLAAQRPRQVSEEMIDAANTAYAREAGYSDPKRFVPVVKERWLRSMRAGLEAALSASQLKPEGGDAPSSPSGRTNPSCSEAPSSNALGGADLRPGLLKAAEMLKESADKYEAQGNSDRLVRGLPNSVAYLKEALLRLTERTIRAAADGQPSTEGA